MVKQSLNAVPLLIVERGGGCIPHYLLGTVLIHFNNLASTVSFRKWSIIILQYYEMRMYRAQEDICTLTSDLE